MMLRCIIESERRFLLENNSFILNIEVENPNRVHELLEKKYNIKIKSINYISSNLYVFYTESRIDNYCYVGTIVEDNINKEDLQLKSAILELSLVPQYRCILSSLEEIADKQYLDYIFNEIFTKLSLDETFDDIYYLNSHNISYIVEILENNNFSYYDSDLCDSYEMSISYMRDKTMITFYVKDNVVLYVNYMD